MFKSVRKCSKVFEHFAKPARKRPLFLQNNAKPDAVAQRLRHFLVRLTHFGKKQ